MKPQCCIYAIKHFAGEQYARVYTPTFHHLFEAKRWLEIMLGDESARHAGNELFLDSGIKLRSYELADILAYTYASTAEQRWQPSNEEMLMIARFRRGIWFAEPKLIDDAIKQSPDVLVKVKTTTKVVMPTGYVKVVDLCKGTAVKAMDARAILRSAMSKPAYGWAFAPEKLADIRKLIGVS